MEWTTTDNYIYGRYKDPKLNARSKVAAFDLDDTLIKPNNGKKFSVSDKDWELFHKNVPNKIKSYYKDDYSIVIVSNQKGISKNKPTKEIWMKKLNKLAKLLNVPFTLIAATQNDLYRKPRTNLWNKYITYDPDRSFYVGDAGGLPKRTIKGLTYKDFSDSDLKFALNLGVKFIHRDEFIFGLDYSNTNMAIDYGLNFDKIPVGKYPKFNPNIKEIIVNVGYPGSGKSRYTRDYILATNNDYVCISQDMLKTQKHCLLECQKAVSENKSIVVDNTNRDKATRKLYLDLAKKVGYKVRCFHFGTDKDISMHNNVYRHCASNGSTPMVPSIVYNLYKSKFEEPTLDEGFSEVVKIEFVLDNKSIDDEYYNYMF